MRRFIPRRYLTIAGLAAWFVFLAGSGVAADLPGTTVVGDPKQPGALQAAILAAYGAGSRHLTVAPGVYVIPDALVFSGLADVEISAYNVELAVDSADSGAIRFENCRKVTFKGAVLRYTKPHTGQAKILAIGESPEGDYCDLQLEPGYPADCTFKASGVVDGKTLRPKADGGTARILQPADATGKTRLYWNGVPGWKKLKDQTAWAVPGDYLVSRGPGGMMFYAKGAERCTFQDLTIYWGGNFGFYESHGCSANRYLHNTITYGPVPPGGTMRPLVSQSADGLHAVGSVIGPELENCLFEGQMDDGVNIHGSFYQVAQAQGNVLTLGFPAYHLDGPREYQPGDRIGIYDLKSKRVVERKIVSVQASRFTTTRVSQHDRFRNCFPRHPLCYAELTLDATVEAPFDSVAWFPGRCGSGYKITGCTVRNSWSRGFLLKADNGLVANNLIEGCLAAGIVISTEMNWGEAGYSRTVTITGNTLRNCANLCIDAYGPQVGALVVTATGMEGMGHRTISICNNTFENINLTNLVVCWAQDVVITGNRFLNPLQRPNLTGDVGKPFGIDPQAVVWIGECDGVTLRANQLVNLGTPGKTPLTVAPTATRVTGIQDGIGSVARELSLGTAAK